MGAVSRWRIELPRENNYFPRHALTDMDFRLGYTAREGGAVLRRAGNAAAGTVCPATAGVSWMSAANLRTPGSVFRVDTAIGPAITGAQEGSGSTSIERCSPSCLAAGRSRLGPSRSSSGTRNTRTAIVLHQKVAPVPNMAGARLAPSSFAKRPRGNARTDGRSTVESANRVLISIAECRHAHRPNRWDASPCRDRVRILHRG